MNYYNDNDPKICNWLKSLVREGLIPPGDVDDRSIADVRPEDLRGYIQCHFFAGIGGWPYALQLSGWLATEPVWTGSCPCQPFSVAGKGQGEKDKRHLWPEFHRLIAECRPPVVFGEQVAGKTGLEWLAGVRADLEDLDYAIGAADLCAAGVGAPHRRQRLYWVADSGCVECADGKARRVKPGICPLAPRRPGQAARQRQGIAVSGESFGVEHGEGDVREILLQSRGATQEDPYAGGPGGFNFWSDFDIALCRNPKGGDPIQKRFEPGTFPLAPRLPGRVVLLRGYGNSIVPQVAAEFVRAYIEVEGGTYGGA